MKKYPLASLFGVIGDALFAILFSIHVFIPDQAGTLRRNDLSKKKTEDALAPIGSLLDWIWSIFDTIGELIIANIKAKGKMLENINKKK